MDHFSTRSIHVASEPDELTGAVVPSLSVATTFRQTGVNKHLGHDYSRTSNPTRNALERVLQSLETLSPTPLPTSQSVHHSEECSTLVFASGCAATAAMVQWAALGKTEGGGGGKDGISGGGGHVLAVSDIVRFTLSYGGTQRYLSRAATSSAINVEYLNMTKAGREGIRKAIRPDTRLIWLEVPTNPSLVIPPLDIVAELVREYDDGHRPLVVIDTTFSSPFFFTPLIPSPPNSHTLADVVLTSLSKYGSGHSDIIQGSFTVGPELLRHRPDVLKGLRFLQNTMGAVPSPRDCHLMIRSVKTLSLRALRHGMNALRLADWLSQRHDVEMVQYPGLKTDPGFEQVESILASNARRELRFIGWQLPLDRSITRGQSDQSQLEYLRTCGIPFGGVVSFCLKGADAATTERFASSLRLISLAESVGGVESLIQVPHGMTHRKFSPETLKELGITPNKMRLSVGIEDVDDLMADLTQGLEKIKLEAL